MNPDLSPDEFNRQFGPELTPRPGIDPHPYGPPPAGQPARTGLTPRGKAGIAIAATVMAGGTLLGWQHYAAAQAANDLKAKELQLQQQQVALEQLKTQTEVDQATQKTQAVADKTRQKQIDACVEADKALIGKQLGSTYPSILKDCQNQYPAAATDDDMQAAASSQTTGDGSVSTLVLVVGGTLAIGLICLVKNSRRNAPPPSFTYHPYPDGN